MRREDAARDLFGVPRPGSTVTRQPRLNQDRAEDETHTRGAQLLQRGRQACPFPQREPPSNSGEARRASSGKSLRIARMPNRSTRLIRPGRCVQPSTDRRLGFITHAFDFFPSPHGRRAGLAFARCSPLTAAYVLLGFALRITLWVAFGRAQQVGIGLTGMDARRGHHRRRRAGLYLLAPFALILWLLPDQPVSLADPAGSVARPELHMAVRVAVRGGRRILSSPSSMRD